MRWNRASHNARDDRLLATREKQSSSLNMRTSRRLQFALRVISLVSAPALVSSQVIDLTVNNVGLAIGDKPRVTGLRLNYRDEKLREVNGVNITLWTPYEPARGTVNGIALG